MNSTLQPVSLPPLATAILDITFETDALTTLAGFALPAKCDVPISPYLIQRHPAFWPDPDVFDPDRFLTNVSATRNRFVYLPFGLGPVRASGSTSRWSKCIRNSSFARAASRSRSCSGRRSRPIRRSTRGRSSRC